MLYVRPIIDVKRVYLKSKYWLTWLQQLYGFHDKLVKSLDPNVSINLVYVSQKQFGISFGLLIENSVLHALI